MNVVAVAALALALQAGPDALSESATRLAQEKRVDEAAALWEKALGMQAEHFPSLFNLGYLRQSQGRFAEAAAMLGRAAKVKPGDFNTRYLLGTVLLKMDRREAALREWRAAVAVQPGNYKLWQIMAVEYGKGWYFRDGCEAARRALAVKGDAVEGWLMAIQACHDARDPEVLELARQAAGKFPENARANFEYGFQLRRAGLREESLPYLKKAMAEDPGYEEPFYFYGDSLLLEDRYSEAAENLRTALRIRPDYIPACVSLAKALMGEEKMAAAVSALEGCAGVNPKHPQPHLLLSQVYFRMGKEEDAAREKNLSLRLRRENPELMESPQARPFPAAPGK